MKAYTFKQPLNIQWHLHTPDGQPFDLHGLTYTIRYKTGRGESVVRNPIVPESTPNVISWIFGTKEQMFTGIYDLSLTIYRNGEQLCKTVYNAAFALEAGGKRSNTYNTSLAESESQLVVLHSVGEWWLYTPIEPVAGSDGFWYVNGAVVKDDEGRFVPTTHSLEYDQETHNLIIDKGIVNPDGISQEVVITSLADALRSQEERFIIAENARKAGETARVKAENTRQLKETARENSEAARSTSEISRNTNEAARVKNEEARKTAEAGRQSSEATRRTAEDLRIKSEKERLANELKRINNETARQNREAIRQSQENERQTSETSRVNRDKTRDSNEDIREKNERQRVAAENGRATRFVQSEEARLIEFNRTQQEKQYIFDSKEAERDEAVEAARKAAGTLAEHDKRITELNDKFVVMSKQAYDDLEDRGLVDPTKFYYIYE